MFVEETMYRKREGSLLKKLFSKLLTLIILLRHPTVPSQQRWFIRFSFKGWFHQLRYFKKDHVLKKPYKRISFCGEFQQELIKVLPFAYWHYKNGTLLATESPLNMAPFYFFSPKHTEVYSERTFLDNYSLEIPNSAHSTFIDKSKWSQVPLKKFYKSKIFCFDKPTLIIANRYNTEWEEAPISYFTLDDLQFIIESLSGKYQIVYNRPGSEHIAHDSSEVLELNDLSFIRKKYPQVLLMEDLYVANKGRVNNFNHLQLMVYANSSNFISIHGGTATLASYFGGKNLIYSRRGHEHPLKEFQRIFPQLSGAKILVARNEKQLRFQIRQAF